MHAVGSVTSYVRIVPPFYLSLVSGVPLEIALPAKMLDAISTTSPLPVSLLAPPPLPLLECRAGILLPKGPCLGCGGGVWKGVGPWWMHNILFSRTGATHFAYVAGDSRGTPLSGGSYVVS